MKEALGSRLSQEACSRRVDQAAWWMSVAELGTSSAPLSIPRMLSQEPGRINDLVSV